MGDDPSAGPIGNLEGDSPVRGTLVERADLGSDGHVAALVRQGDGADAQSALPKAIRPSEARHQAFIAKVDKVVYKRSANVTKAIPLAGYLTDDNKPIEGVELDPATGRPKGWSARDYNVAKDARRPIKTQPGYIAQSLRIQESYHRKDSDKKEAPVLNAEIVQVTVNNQYNYPVRVVEED